MRRFGIICFAFIMAGLLLATSCVVREVPTVETYYETEYRTEYRTETYTETVDAVVESKQGKKYLSPKIKWYTNLVFSGFESSGGTYYYGYQLDPSGHSNAQVEIRISQVAQQQKGLVRVYDLTGIGQIPPRPTPFKDWYMGLYPEELNWLNTFNYTLSTARLLGEVRTGTGMDDYIAFDAYGITEFGILATTWNAYSISSVYLSWVDEIIGKTTVTKERQVPYQVPYQVEKQRTVTKIQKVPVWEVILGK
jgi:hypothetical protein